MPQPENRVSAHLQATGRKENPRPSVSVVMPTLDEARNLPHVIPRLPAWIDELIVVDGYSTDDTVAVAQELFPDVRVIYQSGQGKGDALRCGIEAARADIVVTLDADGSTAPEEIPRFVHALAQGADLAKGSRYLQGGGSDDLTLLRSTGNKGLTLLVNVLFGTRYSDLCYGYNALWRRRAAVHRHRCRRLRDRDASRAPSSACSPEGCGSSELGGTPNTRREQPERTTRWLAHSEADRLRADAPTAGLVPAE